MVECSPTLRKLQHSNLKCIEEENISQDVGHRTISTLAGTPVTWHAALEQVPSGCKDLSLLHYAFVGRKRNYINAAFVKHTIPRLRFSPSLDAQRHTSAELNFDSTYIYQQYISNYWAVHLFMLKSHLSCIVSVRFVFCEWWVVTVFCFSCYWHN